MRIVDNGADKMPWEGVWSCKLCKCRWFMKAGDRTPMYADLSGVYGTHCPRCGVYAWLSPGQIEKDEPAGAERVVDTLPERVLAFFNRGLAALKGGTNG